MPDQTILTEDQYGELITTLVEDEMRHYGYTDDEITAAEQTTHASAGCELQGYEWLCHDENDKSNHPIWDDLEIAIGVIGRVLESEALAATIRQAKAEALRPVVALYQKRCNETITEYTDDEEMFLADLSEALVAAGAVMHDADVGVLRDRYRVECTCGFRSQWHDTESQAARDQEEHEKIAAVVGGQL